MTEEHKTQAQGILDRLFKKGHIPFKLKIASLLDLGECKSYMVLFYDRRIPAVEFSCNESQLFEEQFRSAVLRETERSNGRLLRKAAS